MRDELLRLDTVLDAPDDLVHDRLEVAFVLVVPEPHQAPGRAGPVPDDFDDAVVVLLAGSLPPGQRLGNKSESAHTPRELTTRRDSLLPRIVRHVHHVKVVVSLVSIVHHQHEDGFCEKVGLVRVVGSRRELELQQKVDRVLRRRLPLEAALRSFVSSATETRLDVKGIRTHILGSVPGV